MVEMELVKQLRAVPVSGSSLIILLIVKIYNKSKFNNCSIATSLIHL
jgi:hypothetical protein